METFKDVAAALREADSMLQRGELQKIDHSWHDTHTEPVGVCACGAVAMVAGLETAKAWSDGLFCATYPVLAREVVHPEDGDVTDLVTILSSLNSRSNWTWARMADWLEQLPEPEKEYSPEFDRRLAQ